MVYSNLGNGQLIGVAADTKPTTFPAGTTFYETDTYLTWTWNGYRWELSDIPFNSRKKYGGYYCRGGAGIVHSWGLLSGQQITPYGTHTLGLDTTGLYDRISTGTTQNTIAGHRWARISCRALNFYIKFIFKLGQVTANRIFAGIAGVNANPTSSADYLNATAGIGLWLDDVVSANFKVMHDSGTGASTQPDTSIVAPTTLQTLEIVAVDSVPKFQAWLNGVALSDVTTALIPNTAALTPIIYIENTAGVDKFVDIYDIKIYQDA